MTPSTPRAMPDPPGSAAPVLGRLGRSNLLALLLSGAVHVGLFAGFYYTIYGEASPARRNITPEARLAPAAGPVSERPAPPLRLSQQASPLPANTPRLSLQDMPLIAVAESPTSSDSPIPGLLASANPAPSPGSGSLLNFASPSSSGMAMPTCSFFGAAGNAYKVVYVVDISVSVSHYLRDIAREMSDSIRGLTPAQQFYIITSLTTRGELRITEFGTGRLVYANEKNKREAYEFIRGFRSDTGAFDPIQTLARAYELKPELIYLLSDGDYDDVTEDLPRKVRELYAGHPARITVISFDPYPRHVQLLETIAKQTGGHFRLVEESRLRR